MFVTFHPNFMCLLLLDPSITTYEFSDVLSNLEKFPVLFSLAQANLEAAWFLKTHPNSCIVLKTLGNS